MAFQKLGAAFLLTLMLPVSGWAGVEHSSRVGDSQTNLIAREQQFGSLAVHDANFSAMSRMTPRISCEAAQPPQALATPDPLVDTRPRIQKLR